MRTYAPGWITIMLVLGVAMLAIAALAGLW
jgi:hypothetical protein